MSPLVNREVARVSSPNHPVVDNNIFVRPAPNIVQRTLVVRQVGQIQIRSAAADGRKQLVNGLACVPAGIISVGRHSQGIYPGAERGDLRLQFFNRCHKLLLTR